MKYLISSEEKNIHKIFIFNILIICIVTIVVILFARIVPFKIYDINLLLPEYRANTSPKPIEQMIFLLSSIFIGINSVLSIRFIKYYDMIKVNNFYYTIMLLIIGLVCFCCFLGTPWTIQLFRGHYDVFFMWLFLIFGFLLAKVLLKFYPVVE